MGNNVYGLDIGFGDKKESKRSEGNKIKSSKSPSIIAYASDEAIDMPMFEGKRYYIGESALVSDSSRIIDMTGYEQLEELSPLFIWEFLDNNNLEVEDIDKLVIGLSFAHIKNAKKYIKRISKFKVNGKVYDLSDKIILLPQGVGAKYTIEEFYQNIPKNYLIIDLGFLTLDSVDIINNTVRPENVSGEQGLGVIKIARNIQEYIAEEFNEHISIKEAKEILIDKSYYISGKEHDLSEVINAFSTKYTKMIMSYLEKKHDRDFKKYKKIFFVGGGAHFIKKTKDIIEVLKKPEYANSIGNLLRGEEEINK